MKGVLAQAREHIPAACSSRWKPGMSLLFTKWKVETGSRKMESGMSALGFRTWASVNNGAVSYFPFPVSYFPFPRFPFLVLPVPLQDRRAVWITENTYLSGVFEER